ncbi:MAG: helix-turn-helix transcriptional regulator [bacterium]|nr:helix-turn-helix transcriptional regulator [bacterium]
MNNKERILIAGILAAIAIMVTVDIFSDYEEGGQIWHILVEGTVGLIALSGTFYVMRGSYTLRHRLTEAQSDYSALKTKAEAWRDNSRKYLDGLSHSIDQQLEIWKLTTAEKEVAFLLLKGMSLKEIAAIRQTSEKTARVQSIAIYAKSNLSGRSELAAFFLEDLLVPSIPDHK